MEAVIAIWIAVLGLCVGSFLNVVIGRLPDENEDDAVPWWKLTMAAYKRLAWPPSRCPKCGHALPWYENIPVLSWLALRGKCSGCKAPISPRYLLVELLTGALFLAAFARFPLDWPLVSALTFLTFLIPLIFIDAELWILPFELTLPGIAAGVLLAIPQGPAAFQRAVLGAVAGFLAFRALEFVGWMGTGRFVKDEVTGTTRFMGREALGAGDKYLLAMIGAQLGWRPLLAVIMLSSVQGAIVGVLRLRFTGRAGPGEVAPVPAEGAPEEEEEAGPERFPFTPAFVVPGTPWWKRLLLVPYALLLQDIPDPPLPDVTSGEVPEWEPDTTNIPFGPWIGLAGLEVLLLGPWIYEHLSHGMFRVVGELLFGR